MKTLHPEVAAKYALIGIRPGKYNFKGFGEIDLSTLSVAKADNLVSRGFPHFKLRSGETAAPVSNLKARPIGVPAQKENKAPVAPKGANVEQLRKNKLYVNKILAMDWKDLPENDRKIFFDNEEYFLAKKALLNKISEIDRKMQGGHASVKAMAKDPEKEQERAEIMEELSLLEESKLVFFGLIDTWQAPEPEAAGPAAIKAKAAEEAIAKQKLIAAHENYIYRNEPALANMPETTPAEKKKKQTKAGEIERRKQELITLGKPYERKSRK